jgi:thiol reductant ABC exporter CydD subunit
MKIDKRLLRETGDARQYLSLTVGLSVLVALLIIAQAYLISRIIDSVFLGGQDLNGVSILITFLFSVILTRAGFTLISDAAAGIAANRAKSSLRKKLFSKLFKLGPTYTRSERSGELTNTAGEGVEQLDSYFGQFIPQIFITILVPLVVLVAVFWIDTLSGIVLLVTAPILPFFMALIGKMASALTKKQFKSMSLLSAHFLDVLQGLVTLKTFGRSKAQETTIQEASDRFRNITMKVLKIAFLSALVLEIGATIATAIVAVEIGLRLLYGHIEFQPALFVLLLAPEFYMPFRQLGARFHAGMNGAAASQRIYEILELPPERERLTRAEKKRAAEEKTEEPLPAVKVNYEHLPVDNGLTIEFSNVKYAYERGERPALNHTSFRLEKGQITALVGPSGSGKSTVAGLLLRFLEPEEGCITVNGIDLKNVEAKEWRASVAWVPQNPYLFNSSVLENIKLGKPDATLEEVVEAAKKANAHEFISRLPHSYQTILGERGLRLSGGQLQRISLARAFLRNAPFLLLDEATSNLDPEHEAQIMEATQRLMEGRTVLLIAHRLSTVYKAGKIIVLENGRVAESGTHRELLEQNGLYYRLVKGDSRETDRAVSKGEAA